MMANDHARTIILDAKALIIDTSNILKSEKLLKPESIVEMIDRKYPEIWNKYDIKSRYIEE